MMLLPARNMQGQRLNRQSNAHAASRVTIPRTRRQHRVQALPELVQPIIEAAEANSATTATYAGLGLAASGFVGTFFVAPLFKDAFKEANDWKSMYPDLVKSNLQSITAEEAYLRTKRGSALLDVRLLSKWEELRAEGSISAPLYLPIREWNIASIIRRAGFAFFGIYGTELNETFSQEVSVIVPKGREVIVMCESGGSLDTKPGATTGFQSRSLKAAWYLQQAGYSRILHMKGGLGQWVRDGLPTEEGPKSIPAPPPMAPVKARSRSGSTISEKVLVGTRSLRR